jgi:hypothetical protein
VKFTNGNRSNDRGHFEESMLSTMLHERGRDTLGIRGRSFCQKYVRLMRL